MTESGHPHPTQTEPNTLGLGPVLPPVAAEQLHGSEALLSSVLVDNEAALAEWGINADVLGVIELPTIASTKAESTDEDPTEAGIRIAVVDYGADYADKKIYPQAPGLGSPRSRFGMRQMGDVSEEHPFSPVFIDDRFPEVTLGRGGSGASHDLALDEGQVIKESVVSSSHVTIKLTPEGILVSDHSRNGTKVYRNTESLPKTATEVEPVSVETVPKSRIVGSLSKLATESALITEVPWKTDVQSPEVVDSSETPVAEKVTARESYETSLEEMLKPMSEKDKEQLKSYAANLARKADAQKARDGQASTNYGQYAGQAHRAMSPAAQAIAGDYARVQSSLWNLG